jgi:hypothetical protein
MEILAIIRNRKNTIGKKRVQALLVRNHPCSSARYLNTAFSDLVIRQVETG